MSDPNILLSNMRGAIGLGHPAIAQLSAASLDEHLSHGGALPDDWQQRPTWLLIVVTESDMTEPCVSLHDSFDAAMEHFRTGWDVDGNYEGVDEDRLFEFMRGVGVYASIEQGYRP